MRIHKIASEEIPYRFFYKVRGGEPVKRKEGPYWAKNETRARATFIRKHPYLGQYNTMGETWVEIDKEKLQEIEAAEKRREETKQYIIENAWWNN